MALKHGYTNVDDYKNGVQKKFSLLELGILEKPSTRLLLINVSLSAPNNVYWTHKTQGTHDGLMPIEDSILLFDHGTPKEAR
jgi:hypothetical protein